MTPFAEACVASPIGVALLAVLERMEQPGTPWFTVPDQTTADTVRAAVDKVEHINFGEFLELAGRAARLIGPWVSDADEQVAGCYFHAEARRPIAAAIAERFDAELHAPMNPTAQQWWSGHIAHNRHEQILRPRFSDFAHTYGCGEFTWAGLWTVTDPPAPVHEYLAGEWEMPPPVVRWAMPVVDALAPDRVFEIHRPADWVQLIRSHPTRAASRQQGWELPGGHDRLSKRSAIFGIENQHAAAATIAGHLVPDWASVADSFDAVHLSWAGWITSEGYVSIDDDGVAMMLRYWFSERTCWLADRFGDPRPVGPISIQQGRIADERVDLDRRELMAALSRT